MFPIGSAIMYIINPKGSLINQESESPHGILFSLQAGPNLRGLRAPISSMDYDAPRGAWVQTGYHVTRSNYQNTSGVINIF